MNRIAITGLGVICSAGNNVNEFFHSLDNIILKDLQVIQE
jgi:3-oxoacyl-(acyl-carrier-protein) synthase